MRTEKSREKRDPRSLAALRAAEALFRRLAHLLMDHGVSSAEAEGFMRAVWVRQVADRVAAQRKPNSSWIALITGVDRKEVSRILKSSPRLDPTLGRRHPANKVLTGWFTDPTFTRNGIPSVLPIKTAGRGMPSFWKLAIRYSPGVYPGLILRELCRVGAVEELDNARVWARLRRYGAKKLSNERANHRGPRTRNAPFRTGLAPVRSARRRGAQQRTRT